MENCTCTIKFTRPTQLISLRDHPNEFLYTSHFVMRRLKRNLKKNANPAPCSLSMLFCELFLTASNVDVRHRACMATSGHFCQALPCALTVHMLARAFLGAVGLPGPILALVMRHGLMLRCVGGFCFGLNFLRGAEWIYTSLGNAFVRAFFVFICVFASVNCFPQLASSIGLTFLR